MPENTSISTPQPLTGYRTNEEWDALLLRARDALESLDGVQDAALREQLLALLTDIDSIHREALHRLVRLFKAGVLEQVATDPAIHTLLELYDLLPAGNKPAYETPAVPMKFVRPGEWKRDKATAPGSGEIAPDRQTQTGNAPSAGNTTRSVRAARESVLAHWLPAQVSLSELVAMPSDSVMIEHEGEPLLLMQVRGQVFALDGRCARDGQPMREARLKHYTLVCPHHSGCFYDVRSGKRLAGGGAVQPLVTRVNGNGQILLGIGVPFVQIGPTT